MRSSLRIVRMSAFTAVGAAIAIAGSTGSVAAQHAAAAPEGTVQVAGTVVRLADEPARPAVAHTAADDATGGHDTAVRTADGVFVPVPEQAVAGLDAGTPVTVTAKVPRAVTAAATSTNETLAPDGTTVPVDRDDLAQGLDGTPAEPTSRLAKATAASAARTGTTLTTTHTQVAGAAVSSYTRGVHDLTIAVVVPQGLSGASATNAQLAAQVANASAYWSRVSGGGITLRIAKITPLYTSAYRCGDDVFALWSEAAQRSGFVEGPNKHLVISFPKEAARAGCPYGLASIGAGVNNGGVNIVSDTAWPVLAHEIGHNFGLGHAKALQCTRGDVDLTSVPSGCALVEYGYPWDVMAASSLDSAGTLSSVQASRIGLISGADVVEVASGVRTVTLSPMYTESGVRAIRVVDPKSGAVYFVEYRVRSGIDSRLYQNVANGVRVLQVDRTAWQERGSVTLDATPTGRASDVSREITPGATFRSYSGGVSVTVQSVGARAVVRVATGAAAAAPVKAVRPAAKVAPAPPRVSSTTARVNARASAAKVAWTGGGSAARYDVQYRQVVIAAGGRRSPGPVRTWKARTAATGATLTARPGTTYQFRAQVAGRGGWSGWHSASLPTARR